MFSVTFIEHDWNEGDENGRVPVALGRWTYSAASRLGLTREEYEARRLKIETAYLGPWCPNCGKRGKKCLNRAKCRQRSILAAKTAQGVTLDMPPDDWFKAKGKNRRCLSESQLREARREFTYEQAMSKPAAAEAACPKGLAT